MQIIVASCRPVQNQIYKLLQQLHHAWCLHIIHVLVNIIHYTLCVLVFDMQGPEKMKQRRELDFRIGIGKLMRLKTRWKRVAVVVGQGQGQGPGVTISMDNWRRGRCLGIGKLCTKECSSTGSYPPLVFDPCNFLLLQFAM